MSLESASERRYKRIVNHIITGFNSADEAITFGNTVNSVIQEKVTEFVKFRQLIGSPDTTLAITEGWQGRTVLKTSFLELGDQNTAIFICEAMKQIVASHMKIHPDSVLAIAKEIVREKPQPQFLKR